VEAGIRSSEVQLTRRRIVTKESTALCGVISSDRRLFGEVGAELERNRRELPRANPGTSGLKQNSDNAVTLISLVRQ
jgi:hypothetical protein